MKAVIIDDEQHCRESLKEVITKYAPEITIVGEGNDVASGIKTITEQQPDVVFMDIEMPDGSGFQLLDALSSRDFHLIMVTGYNSYAIKAIRYSALDYLVKPVDLDEFNEAINRLRSEKSKGIPESHLQIAHNGFHKKQFETIALPSMHGYNLVNINDIVAVQADGSYSIVITKEKSYTVSRIIKEFGDLLPDDQFFRIHKSTIVNLREIKEYVKGKGGYVIMHNDSHFDVSTRRKEHLIAKLVV